jgi:pyruvate/2-oxoglutarate dehydrogenase complex dihydrolipoamide dehydrogenase (E3) component
VRTGPVSVDLAAVRERKRAMVGGARENYASRLAHEGLDLIQGEARFTGPKTLEVALTDGGVRPISAPVIVIDAGTRARPLAIDGAGEIAVLDSTSIMELDEVPEHLIVLGGGYIGLEFGQMFRRFGSEVTIIEGAPRLMMMEDEDVADEVAAILRDDGITVLTSTTPLRVEQADGGLTLTVRTADGERRIEGSQLLSAIGRVPNTEALAPEAAGLRLDDRGFIEVDEYLETSVPGVYAMGDIKGGPAFTHLSYDDYRILHANLIRHQKQSTRDRIVPYTVFTDPQLGRAGLTERAARAQGRDIRVAKLPMGGVIRAIETGETRGFMKAVIDSGSGQILGCAILGLEGGEIMSIIQVAMLGQLPYTAMANAIFSHPLLAEGLNTLFAMFDA